MKCTFVANSPVFDHAVARTDCRAQRAGFTLMELVVSSALMATLMLGLWGLVNIFTSLSERGISELEGLREATELFQVIESDLRSVPAAMLASQAAVLSGDDAALTLGYLAPIALDWLDNPAENSLVREVTQGEGSTARRSIVRRVNYEMANSSTAETERVPGAANEVANVSLDESSSLGLDNRPTLWRQDELHLEIADDTYRDGESFAPGEPLLPIETQFDSVEAVRFGYYNGKRWTNRWDSSIRGVLPVAVRVEVWFRGGSSLAPRRSVEEESDVVSLTENEHEAKQDSPEGAAASTEIPNAEKDGRDRLGSENDPFAVGGANRPPARPADLTRWVSLR